MSANVHIYLPGNVRIEDVATVIALLSGNKPNKQPLTGGSYFTAVPGSDISSGHAPGCYTIYTEMEGFTDDEIKALRPDGINKSRGFWCYECSRPPNRYLSGGDNLYWKKIGCGLVDFFGGWVEDNDCDDTTVNYSVKAKSNAENCPEDGEPWRKFQQRLLDLNPIRLTSKELKDARKD